MEFKYVFSRPRNVLETDKISPNLWKSFGISWSYKCRMSVGMFSVMKRLHAVQCTQIYTFMWIYDRFMTRSSFLDHANIERPRAREERRSFTEARSDLLLIYVFNDILT